MMNRAGGKMAKHKTVFVCQECGYESTGWLGKCPACMQWNTFAEEVQESRNGGFQNQENKIQPISLGEIRAEHE